MNLFALATRGVDLDALPTEEPAREPLAFEQPTNFKAPSDFDKVFADAGDAYGVDPAILKSMALAESGFRPEIIRGERKSSAGAIGLMQFMPNTAKEYGIDPLNPVEAIFGAAAYMRQSLDKFGGDYGKAVASYNHGAARDAYNHDDWDTRLPPETQGYLMKVFGAVDQFKGQSAPSAAVTDTGDETARLAARYKAPIQREAVPNMTPGSVAQDALASVLKVGPTAVKGVGELASLATGGRIGQDFSKDMQQRMDTIDQMVGSERGAAQKRNFQRDMADDRASIGDALLNNKGAMLDMALPSLGSMLLPVGAAGAAGKVATLGKVAQGLDKAALAARVASVQQAAGIGATVAQNAASTFAELVDKGVPLPDAYTAAGITVPFSLIAGKLTGGGAEGALVKTMGGNGVAAAVKRGAIEVPKSMLREGGQEVGEEAGQITGEAIGTGQAPSMQNVGKQLAVAGAMGGLVGGGMNLAQQTLEAPTVESQPTTPQAPPVTPVAPTTQAANAVDRIQSILEAERNADTQGSVVPATEQATDAGAAPGVEGRTEAGQTSGVQADQAGQPEQAQSLSDGPLIDEGTTAPTEQEQALTDQYAASVNKWNNLSSEFKTATPERQAELRPVMDELNREQIALKVKFQQEAMTQVKANLRTEAAGKFEAMPVGTKVGIPGYESNDGINWEKVGDNEWVRNWNGERSKSKANADMEGGRIIGGGLVAEMAALKARSAPVVNQQMTTEPAQQLATGLAAEMAKIKGQGVAKAETAAAPVAKTTVPATGPAFYGQNGTPVAEGGKPFKTRAQADAARKLQPMMRVKAQGKGFVLTEKTPAQIAAQEKAARRNLGSVGAGGGPLSAHAFLASQGGLSKSTMADLGFDTNVRVGSKWLFTNAGMTLEGMTEALQQNGYVQGTEQNPAIEMVKRSANGQPQYTAEGWEQIAQAEATARFEDHLAAQQEAAMADDEFDPFAPENLSGDFDGDDLAVAGYDAASDPIKLEVNALLEKAESLGIDTDTIKETAYEDTKNEPEQAYYERVRDELTRAINASTGGRSNQATDGNAQSGQGPDAQRGSRADSRQDDGREGTPGTDREGLTTYTPEEVTARQDAAAQAEATAKRAEEAAARAEAAAKQANEIAQRSLAAADTFELGGNAEDNLSGQEGLKFSKRSDGVEVGFKPGTQFLQAKSDAGLVGGTVKDGVLRINSAEVAEGQRGQGNGLKLYQSLIDKALDDGLKVTSDSTVEAEAVRVYEALGRRGYTVTRLDGGTTEDGAAYGRGAKEPAFEVSRSVGGKAESLSDITRSLDDAGVSNTISERDGVITVSKIVVPKDQRNSGIGTDAMQRIVAYADRTGQHIALTPSADFGGNKSRLTEFYKRFGFKENKGRNRVFSVSESMVRENPKGRTLFSFAGSRAASADRMALMTAQDRIDAGEDAETVRQETGWFKGVDGRWRFEISDSDAVVDTKLLGNLSRGGFDARPIEFVTYRKDDDGTYRLTLTPKNPEKTTDFVSLSGVPEILLPSILPTEAQNAITNNTGEEDYIGGNLDDALRVRAPFQFEGFNALPLEVVMDHPKLFAAYPALREIMVRVDTSLGNGATFAEMDYVDGTKGKEIRIGNPKAANVDNVLLHEIQHGIQSIEGFATGGSPNGNAKNYAAQLSRELSDLIASDGRLETAYRAFEASQNSMVQAFSSGQDFDAEAAQRNEDALTAMPNGQKVLDMYFSLAGLESDLSAPSVMRDRYKRLAGEVEARNTQTRQRMTDAERRNTAPGATADVADSDVIVVMNGKEMASAPMPENAQGMKPTAPKTPISTITEAITKAYGNALTRLQGKGLVTLTQTEDEALKAAAAERAKVNGTSEAVELKSLRASVDGGTVDVKRSVDGHLQGFHDPATGKTFMVADNLTAETAPAVFMHEVGIHMAADGKMEPLFKRALSLLKLGRNNAFIQRVQGRMDVAGETSGEEAAAYITEEYERDRTNAPASVTSWVKDFIADVRAWLFSKGVLLKADQLTVADIAAVARANVRGMAMGQVGDGAVKNSVASTDQTQTAAFKKWFGDSKVVDADGKPMTVYHGTKSAFTAFNGDALFFARDRSYAEGMIDGDGKVMDVYLSIKNPLRVVLDDMQFGASWAEEEYIEKAKRNGNDGVVFTEEEGFFESYVAFNPTQIKSATGNNGDFDSTNPDIRRSVAPAQQPQADKAEVTRSLWKDEQDRVQFAPGAWLFDKMGKVASPVLSWAGMKAASPELKKQLREMKLGVQKAQETSAMIATEASKLTQDEREMVSDLIEKTLKAGVVPPAHAVKLAALINQTMSAQTDELIELGMLSAETAERWRGEYLPRFYADKLRTKTDPWADALKNITKRARMMMGVKGKHLKARGLFETVPTDQIADYEALGWELRDPGFDPANDKTAQMWRDFTKEERENMGEIRDAGFRFVMGYMQTQKDIALGRMFKRMATSDAMSSRVETGDMNVRVPDTKVEGTGANVYGALSGRYVSKDTLDHLSGFGEVHNDMLQTYRKAMSLWKEGKTVLNPVSHINNTVSNVTMAHLAGVGYHRVDKYAAAVRDLATSAPMVKQAKDAGLFLGGFNEAELFDNMPDELKELAKIQEGTGTKVVNGLMQALTFGLRKHMGKAYEFEDSFFKYLIFRDSVSRGMSPGDAVDYAQKFIFTYDDLPKTARKIRDFGMPFFAYTYKAIPALLESTLKHPERMALPASMIFAATTLAYAMAEGGDDEPFDELVKRYATDEKFREAISARKEFDQKHLPKWMRGYTSLATPKSIRVGFDEALQMPVFMDISRLIPGGDLFDVTPNAGGLPMPQPITPNHPVLTMFTGLIANKDTFKGADIVDKNDTSAEAAEKRTAWIYRQVAPAIAAGNYHWDRGMEMIAQANGGEIKWLPDALSERYTGMGKDGLPITPEYGIPQTFGIKIRPMDQDKAEQIESAMDNKLLREIDAEIRQIKRLNNMGAMSDKMADKKLELQYEKKDRIRDGMTVDGDQKN